MATTVTAAALFSRLQLAAALLEYDNDPDNPDAPTRSAKDSAIFAHLRRNPAARPDLAPRKSDYLGLSESGSVFGRESALDTRRSRASKVSIDALRNPFHADTTSDGHEEEERDEEGLEVDLASWGLDAFMPKDKKSAKAKGKQPAAPPAVGSTRARIPSTYEASLTAPRHGLVTARSVSLGGDIEADELLSAEEHQRRRSFGSPLDLVGMEASGAPFHSRRRAPSQASLTPVPGQLAMVPFPSGSICSTSSGPEHAYGETGQHNRTYSSATMGSRFMLDETKNDAHDRPRTFSSDTLGMPKLAEDNPFAIQNPSQFSRFDPKAATRTRSYSNATMGSRLKPENDAFSVVNEDPYTRERRFSTLELLRPKVLVMPSPLQPVSNPALSVDPVAPKVRDGFELTKDGPPLPPGARASRRLSSASLLLDPTSGLVPSNSFTPTPFNDLTLSQKTFRSMLSVPGQLTAYSDFPTSLPRATEEGEQAVFNPSGKDEGFPIMSVPDPNSQTARPAGKLYGKSLIDDLEMRKAQMRSKQRVFTGDQRPSMMARDSHRVSTLIDPATLNARPGFERTSSYGTQLSTSPGANLGRHPSVTMKPLITFDGEDEKVLGTSPPNASRLQGAKSVFGVDTLWQKEMEKLKEMKAVEEKENLERQKREEEEERRKEQEKNKRKKKGKDKQETEQEETLPVERHASPRVSAEPPTLPNIPRAPRRAPPKPSDSDFSSEESDDDDEVPVHADTQGSVAWHSSDEDDGPRRTTGVGLRYPKNTRKMSNPPPKDDDSDSDLPLAATIQKARAKLSTAPGYGEDDSEDEDQPLSRILKAKSVKSMTSNSRKLAPAADEDEDNVPLALRASRIPFQQMNGGEDEDDMPLAFHPEQQRKSQFQMLAAQQQQQQQQMMMQAQFQNNMMMNTPMMTPSYYAPPMMNPMAMMQMMPPPMSIPSPPPIQDEVKFGRVDRWRRDVAVDGDT